VPRRRKINGVVAGILGSFVSRNNDIGGYWAIGKLYEHARKNQTHNLTIDLATSEILPDGLEFRPMVRGYSSRLADRLAYYAVPMEFISIARIALAFDAAVLAARPPSSMPGMPFRCTLEVIDKLGRGFAASHVGVARPHNPLKETRSARV
jgi:hypothetical protein